MAEQTQDMNQDNFGFSPETQQRLDDMARDAINKIDRRYVAALITMKLAIDGADYIDICRSARTKTSRELCASTRATNIRLAQNAYRVLVEGRRVESFDVHHPALAMADMIKRALADKSIQPYEIAPRFKDPKEKMLELVEGQLGFFMVFSSEQAQRAGSSCANVKGRDGKVIQVEYTDIYGHKNWPAQCRFPDTRLVYSAKSQEEAGFKHIRKIPKMPPLKTLQPLAAKIK